MKVESLIALLKVGKIALKASLFSPKKNCYGSQRVIIKIIVTRHKWCLIKRMRMQFIPGPFFSPPPSRKMGLGKRLVLATFAAYLLAAYLLAFRTDHGSKASHGRKSSVQTEEKTTVVVPWLLCHYRYVLSNPRLLDSFGIKKVVQCSFKSS